MTDYNTLIVERREAVTLVTLNRPQALNALNAELLSELLEVMHAYDADPEQRCAVITGYGDLSVWVPNATGGTWQRTNNVSFAATVDDGGNLSICNKKSCKNYERPDFFGIRVDGVVLTGESAPIALSGGAIRVK